MMKLSFANRGSHRSTETMKSEEHLWVLQSTY
jgi:hypothetical protein